MPVSPSTQELLNRIVEYRNRAHVTRRSQYLASTRYEHRNLWLGVPVVLVTAVVGTSIFATLQDNPNIYVKIAVGILSISATVLAALQTYLGYSEKAAKHKAAGANYASIWRALDVLHLELCNKGDEFSAKAIDQLKDVVEKLDGMGKESPSVHDRDYRLAAEELRSRLAGRRPGATIQPVEQARSS